MIGCHPAAAARVFAEDRAAEDGDVRAGLDRRCRQALIGFRCCVAGWRI